MQYNKNEVSLLNQALAYQPNLRTDRVIFLSAVLVWIGAAAGIVSDLGSVKQISMWLIIAGFFGVLLGFVRFRNRALSLIQKLTSDAHPTFLSSVVKEA